MKLYAYLLAAALSLSVLLNPSGLCRAAEQLSSNKHFNSVSEITGSLGPQVRAKLKAQFKSIDIDYPPPKLTWIALKKEKALLVFAQNKNGTIQQLLSYRILGASGKSGPKLKEGDKQVPEGFYKLSSFKPTIIAHMGMEVNYPNHKDRLNAKVDGRKNLGGDILIHGSYWSTGCLAMGNPAIEELFILAYDCGLKNIDLIFAPCKLSENKADWPVIHDKNSPKWLPALYESLSRSLARYPIDLSKLPPLPEIPAHPAKK